jgi:hypothetical protein
MTQTVHMVKIEDHEGEGRCGACQREGLRWIVTMSDGSQVGTECAKRVMGYKPAPKSYAWVADYQPVAEHTECPASKYAATYVLWQHKAGTKTIETRNGVLQAVGGVRQAWERKGWL